MAMVIRGSFRLVVGFVLTVIVAWSVLWVLNEILGSGAWISENAMLNLVLAIGAALAVGVGIAVAWDRAWMRIRGRGPELKLKRP